MIANNVDGDPISDEFKEIWLSKGGRDLRRRIGYKRRYWNGATFTNEAAYSYLYEVEFEAWGEIPFELDTPLKNVFRAPTVTLRLKNDLNQWVPHAGSPSVFASDDTATEGYRLPKSIFRLEVGYELSSGTIEWVPVFTGYAVKPVIRSRDGCAEVTVVSRSALLLEKSDAAKVCTPFTLENCSPATGDGSNVNFKSTSTGVGRIDDLQVDGASVDLEDYSVGNLDAVADPDSDGKATITVNDQPGVVPGAGKTVKCSGIKWLQDQEIKDLLQAIADNAGVASIDQLLDEVLIPGGATASVELDSEADWETFTAAANLSTVKVPGSIKRKWWEVNVATTGSPVVSNGSYVSVPDTGTYHLTMTTVRGVKELHLIPLGSTILSDTQYTLQLSGTDNSLRFYYGNVEIGSATLAAGAHEIAVSRDDSGNFKIYSDGAEVITVTDDKYVPAYVYLVSRAEDAPQTVITETDRKVFVSSDTEESGAVVEADVVDTYAEYVIDLGSVPSALGILERLQDLNGGSVTYKTAGAVDSAGSPGTFESLVEISASGQMQSTPLQWLKIRIDITPDGFDSPVVHRVTVNYATDTVVLSLAILEGMTGAQAFEQLATLVDYWTGDDELGRRFFRSKTVTADAAVILTQESGIVSLDWDSGDDAVVTVGRVRTNGRVFEWDAAAAGDSSPTSEEEYGRTLPQDGVVDLPDFVLLNDLNLAAVRAKNTYDAESQPKRRWTGTMWSCPWLQVGDKVNLTFLDSPIMARPSANDPQVTPRPFRSATGTPGNVLANDDDAVVLRYYPNFETGVAQLYAEEILS